MPPEALGIVAAAGTVLTLVLARYWLDSWRYLLVAVAVAIPASFAVAAYGTDGEALMPFLITAFVLMGAGAQLLRRREAQRRKAARPG